MRDKSGEIGKAERFGYWLFGAVFVLGIAQLAVPWLAWVGWAPAIYGFMVAISITGEHGQKGCLFFAVLGYGLLFAYQFGLQYAKQSPGHWITLYMCSLAVLGAALLHFMAGLARHEAEWELKCCNSDFDTEAVHAGHSVSIAIVKDPPDHDTDDGH